MSATYAPRHATPPRLTPVLLAGLDAAVLAVAVLALVIAWLAFNRTPVTVTSAPVPAVSAPAPVHAKPVPVASHQTARTRPAPVTRYTVMPGDSLWSIAGASWPRMYIVNRAVIGPDPGMLRAGEVLIIPRP